MATWGTPIERGRFTAPFGEVRKTGIHKGTDIGPPSPGQTGVPVYCMGPGTVSETGFTSIRGYWVLVLHDDGTYSRYQHLAVAPSVNAGQRVQSGTTVGICGATGRATGIHLHLEAYPAGANPGGSQNGAIDPEAWALARGVNLRALGALPDIPDPDPTPIPTPKERTMRVIQGYGQNEIYATDGVRLVHITTTGQLNDLLRIADQTAADVVGGETINLLIQSDEELVGKVWRRSIGTIAGQVRTAGQGVAMTAAGVEELKARIPA